MKILLSNDDGVQASGINFLYEQLKTKNKTIVIAPHKERSSCGHGISLGEALRVNQVNEDIYECSGLPADCILIGIGQICKNEKPDLVVSGINHGANLGQDCFYSGTIAAAREAAFRGIPSIAVSLVTLGIKDVEHFEVAAKFIERLVQKEIHKHIPKGALLNVNVPNLADEEISGVKMAFTGFQQYSEDIVERVDTRGRKYYWVGGTYQGPRLIEGSDGEAIKNNFISVDLQALHPFENIDPTKIEEIIKGLNDKN